MSFAHCPGCGRQIQIFPEDAGKKIECAVCNTRFQLFGAAPAGEPRNTQAAWPHASPPPLPEPSVEPVALHDDEYVDLPRRPGAMTMVIMLLGVGVLAVVSMGLVVFMRYNDASKQPAPIAEQPPVVRATPREPRSDSRADKSDRPETADKGMSPDRAQTGRDAIQPDTERVRFERPLLIYVVLNDRTAIAADAEILLWLMDFDTGRLGDGQTVRLKGEFTFAGTKTYIHAGGPHREYRMYAAAGPVTVELVAAPRNRETTPDARANPPAAAEGAGAFSDMDAVDALSQFGKDEIEAGRPASGRVPLAEARRRCEKVSGASAGTFLESRARAKLVEIDGLLRGLDKQETPERVKPLSKTAIREAVTAYLLEKTGNASYFEVLSISEPEVRKVRDNSWQPTTVGWVRFRAVVARRWQTLYWIFAVKDGAVVQTCEPNKQSEMFGGGSIDR